MEWQLLFALGLVAAAASYLLRRTWRTWTARKGGCAGGCGCAGAPKVSGEAALISSQQLLNRLKQSS